MGVEVSEGGVAQQEMFPASGDAQTSTPPADSGVSDVASVTDDLGIDEDVAKMFADNDPDFVERLKAKPQEGETNNNGGDDHSADGETPGENSATADEQKGDSPAPADGKDSGGNDETLEFKDDVIPGLKGEVLAKLPKEAQEAVADFYGAVEERAKKVEASEVAMNLLKQDPYLKSRIEAMEAGTQAQIRGLTPDDEKAIAEGVTKFMVEKLTIEDVDAAEVVAAFKGGIMTTAQRIAQQMAQDYAAQALQSQEALKETREVIKQGDAVLLGLSEFDKSLAVKEKDLSKFYVTQNGKTFFNEKHPEIETFKNGIGQFIAWASERGINYNNLAKMGAKAFYAAAAADLNRPVAFNTKERDDKMVSNAVKQKLKPFLKTDGGTLDVGGGNAAQGGGAEPKIIHGFNAVKLVEDGAYREEMYLKHALDADMIDKLDAAASVGRDIIEKQSKTRR